jgi:hypothetical protein
MAVAITMLQVEQMVRDSRNQISKVSQVLKLQSRLVSWTGLDMPLLASLTMNTATGRTLNSF